MARPQTLLLVLVAAVPVVVGIALVVGLLLQRAGFGLVVWAVLPFVVSMALIVALGTILGRAATRRGPDDRRSGRNDRV